MFNVQPDGEEKGHTGYSEQWRRPDRWGMRGAGIALINYKHCEPKQVQMFLSAGVILTFLGFLRRLVDNGAVLQTAQVKHADTAVAPTADKHVNAVRAEPHVIDFLVVRNELRFGRQGWNVPDRTCRVNA